MCRWRNQRRTETSRARCRIRQTIFTRWNIGRQRIEILQAFRVKLAFSGWRRKVRLEQTAHRRLRSDTQPFSCSSSSVTSVQSVQRLLHQIFIGVFETRIVKSHALPQAAGRFPYSACSRPAGRWPGVFSIAYVWPYDRCRSRCSSCVVAGRQDVGIVRRVGLKVLQHDGKQILARQARQHPLLIRRDGAWIAVVNDERAHRRVRIRQALRPVGSC